MLTVFFSMLPFFVCLFWSVLYALNWKKHNSAQRILTVFAGVCTVLYACHAQFFIGEQCEWGEWLWMTCSLAVYPLYYFYIICLATPHPRFLWTRFFLLLPAFILPSLLHFFPILHLLSLREICMALIVLYVCFSGLYTLNKFEHEIHEFYADTEDKSSHSIRILLMFFTFCSVCSVIFSSIGRELFQHNALLMVPSLLFSVLLFAVFYLGERYTFMAQEMSVDDERVPATIAAAEEEALRWIPELERLMKEEKIFLEPNLKIADVASRAGTCRTYISNYINQQKGVSFSDYINEQRIRYAEQLLLTDSSLTIEYLAAATGFASEQSFVRNFRKFSSSPLHK